MVHRGVYTLDDVLIVRAFTVKQIKFHVFYTVPFNIILQYKPTKSAFSKLILQFIMSSTCFEPEGSSAGRWFYVQLRYIMYLHAEMIITDFRKKSKYKIFELL